MHQTPLEDIRKWSHLLLSASNVILHEGILKTFEAASSNCVEIELRLKRGASRSVSVYLRRSPDATEQTELRYEWEAGLMTLDRSRSSLNPLVKRDVQTTTYKTAIKDAINLVIYLDDSVQEVFIDGRATFATRVYPTLDESGGLAAGCTGGDSAIESLIVRSISLDASDSQASNA